VRRTRYQQIADELRARFERDEFPAGALLPSESELSRAYAASRVTVRRALDELRQDGLVDSRQGFGWFAAADPLRQTLGRLGTLEAQLAATGKQSERRILDFGFTGPPARVSDLLGPEPVLQVRRVNLADGRPFARVTVWCPGDLGGGLSRSDVEQASFYDLLPLEVGGAVQTIGAGAAEPEDARILDIPEGSPVLVCERVTTDTSDKPVLVSEFVFPAHLTEFVVDLPSVESSIAPTGLRLVE
jgi:GntR family transcriptional regulator